MYEVSQIKLVSEYLTTKIRKKLTIRYPAHLLSNWDSGVAENVTKLMMVL